MSDTQEDAILRALLSGRSLTPLEALREFGCMRLGARIFNLRKQGYAIEATTEHVGKKHWARYRMAKGAQYELIR